MSVLVTALAAGQELWDLPSSTGQHSAVAVQKLQLVSSQLVSGQKHCFSLIAESSVTVQIG